MRKIAKFFLCFSKSPNYICKQRKLFLFSWKHTANPSLCDENRFFLVRNFSQGKPCFRAGKVWFSPHIIIDSKYILLRASWFRLNWFFFYLGWLVKGQLISKANCQAVNSSWKQTNEFVFNSMLGVFVCFLEEIEESKKAFRNYRTFKKSALIQG